MTRLPAAFYRPFRPRRGPAVAIALGVIVTAGFVFLLLTIRDLDRWGLGDRAGTAVLLLAGLWFLYRQASVVARVDERGIEVHNLVERRRLEWAQIISVRFGQGRPWARLDLSDGTTVAVMAIQASDGRRGQDEAVRLATLVQAHEAGGSA